MSYRNLHEYWEEIVSNTVAQQEAKLVAYNALTERGLPIPPDLKHEVEAHLAQQKDTNA